MKKCVKLVISKKMRIPPQGRQPLSYMRISLRSMECYHVENVWRW